MTDRARLSLVLVRRYGNDVSLVGAYCDQLSDAFGRVQEFGKFDESADLSATESAQQQCRLAGATIRHLLALSKVELESGTTEVGGLVRTVSDKDGSTHWVAKEPAAAAGGGGGGGSAMPETAMAGSDGGTVSQPKQKRHAGGGISISSPAAQPAAAAAAAAAASQEQSYTVITRTGKEPTGATVWIRLYGSNGTASPELQLGTKGSIRKHETDRFTLKVPATAADGGPLMSPIRRVEIWHDNR